MPTWKLINNVIKEYTKATKKQSNKQKTNQKNKFELKEYTIVFVLNFFSVSPLIYR